MIEDGLIRADRALTDAAKDIRVLSRLSWPIEIQQNFLEGWRNRQPKLPEVEYRSNADLADRQTVLVSIVDQLAPFDGPIAEYLRATAQSYLLLCDLLQKSGTPAMFHASRALYGTPRDPLSGGDLSSLDAAKHFLTVSRQYYESRHLRDADYCLPADVVAEELRRRLSEVFDESQVTVSVDPTLASKAAAGATRVRLRSETCFSEYDVEQLLQHEAFVHSLTALNGRSQPALRCLGLGAPRTTATQEGLATFAETVTGAIDIDRMERIALRVIGIDMALSGADFIDVFKFFVDAGQSELESFNSTMRIFRGAPVTGGSAFTKDGVYVHGLMEIHTFFRWAMTHQRLELCRYLFAGRMTINDVINFSQLFSDGTLEQPKHLPPWMLRTNGLAGYLAFSVFANKVSVESLGEEHRFDQISDLHG